MAFFNVDPRLQAQRAAEIVARNASALLDNSVNIGRDGRVSVGRFQFPQPPPPVVPPRGTGLVVDHDYPTLDTSEPALATETLATKAIVDFQNSIQPVYAQPAVPPSDDTAAFDLLRDNRTETNGSTNESRNFSRFSEGEGHAGSQPGEGGQGKARKKAARKKGRDPGTVKGRSKKTARKKGKAKRAKRPSAKSQKAARKKA